MFKYFDKTFFRFLTGFTLILLASFTVLFIAGYLKNKADKQGTPAAAVNASISE